MGTRAVIGAVGGKKKGRLPFALMESDMMNFFRVSF